MTATPLTWRKSTYSGSSSACVEIAAAPPIWRKSTYSGSSGECVEVAAAAGTVLVRNSNHPDAGTLAVAAGAMSGWLAACRAGALDDLTR